MPDVLPPRAAEQVGHLGATLDAVPGVRVESVMADGDRRHRHWTIRAVCSLGAARIAALAALGHHRAGGLAPGVVSVALRVG